MKIFRLSLILIIIFLLLHGCSSSGIVIDKTVFISGFDFTKYYKKGFLFSPEQYLGEYESIGLLEIEIIPDVRKVWRSKDNPKATPGWIMVPSYNSDDSYWEYNLVSPEEILDTLYSKSRKMGADAVVRLQISTKQHNNGEIFFLSTVATGFAIKRKP